MISIILLFILLIQCCNCLENLAISPANEFQSQNAVTNNNKNSKTCPAPTLNSFFEKCNISNLCETNSAFSANEEEANLKGNLLDEKRNLVLVSTIYGKLKGLRYIKAIEKDKRVAANVFLGVPFAQPPIGELRFEVNSTI